MKLSASVAKAAIFSLALASAPAYAIFAKLSTNLIAQYVLNGVTPSGKASINQSSYPAKPAVLSLSVSRVSAANGTVLPVLLSDCPWFGPVAYLNIVDRSARLNTNLPSVCQIGRSSTITIAAPDGSILLMGGAPWKI